MRESLLEDMEVYITRRQNTVAQYIAIQPIPGLCEKLERKPGVRISKSWWEKEGIKLSGMR